MGVFEFPAFAERDARAWPQALAAVPGLTVVGGGDSAAAVRTLGFADERLRPHLDRWRREPGVPRGQDPARPSGSGDAQMATTRKPLMAGNWKMNLNHLEAIHLVQDLAFRLADKDYDAVDVVVLPPFTDIRSVQTLVDADHLTLGYGAQDVSPHDSGAFTGEVSGSDAGETRLRVRRGRSLRTPSVPRRRRRDGRCQGAGGPPSRPGSDRLRR